MAKHLFVSQFFPCHCSEHLTSSLSEHLILLGDHLDTELPDRWFAHQGFYIPSTLVSPKLKLKPDKKQASVRYQT